jgi:ferredoxin
MPAVRFVGPNGSADVEVDVPEGGRLLDVCDDAAAPVPFSCRGASCGTCRVEVIEGLDRLEPASEDELEVLAMFRDPPTRRLACQARLVAGRALVVLRAVVLDD